MKFFLLFLILFIHPTDQIAQANTRHVPSQYATIQSAINAATTGDTVLVQPGTYFENINFRGKRIVVTSTFFQLPDYSVIDATIINGSTPAHADTGSCVLMTSGENASTILQGFTLTGGTGTKWNDEHGAGAFIEGGGVLIALSSPTIQLNIIRNNNVNRTGGSSTGGGGIRLGDGSPKILNNIIINNQGMYGGGIVSNFATPVIRNNVIASNIVSAAVAGPTYGGGGIWINNDPATVENNTIVGNSSTGPGSASAGRGGGIACVFGGSAIGRNNIVWGNIQTTGPQVYGPTTFTYNDIEGGFSGTGNINKNPAFSDNNYHLLSASPCIDAGDTNAALNDPENILNPGTARFPARGGLRGDMGAYGGPGSRFFNGNYFVPPELAVVDSGTGTGALARWSPGQSPYGAAVSYIFFYGISPLVSSDSLATTDTVLGITGLTEGTKYYFSVLEIDYHSNRSMLSNQVDVTPLRNPHSPTGLSATGLELSIQVTWDRNSDLDISGYNLYRHTSIDSIPVKLNSTLLFQTAYIDSNLRGDRTYNYNVTAVDILSNEGDPSEAVGARLLPPSPPKNLLTGPGKTFIKLIWSANTEPDLKGYNVYRSTDSVAGYTKINNDLVMSGNFKDSVLLKGIPYYYRVTAVDTTDGESDFSARAEGHTVPMNKGILAINYNSASLHPSRDAFYRWLLAGYTATVDTFVRITDTSSVYTLGDYSSVLWFKEGTGIPALLSGTPVGLQRYVLGGGKILITTRTVTNFSNIRQFLFDLFGVDINVPQICTSVVGASSSDVFPYLKLDPLKPLVSVFTFPSFDSSGLLYSFDSANDTVACEKAPIGFRAMDQSVHAFFLSFPMYYIDSTNARELITKVLQDFGEVPTGISANQSDIPQEFHLYPAYPNPFNPISKISYSIPTKENVSLKIYDLLGREVTTLRAGYQVPGFYEATWDAGGCASGVYFYRLEAGGFIEVKKILLMK